MHNESLLEFHLDTDSDLSIPFFAASLGLQTVLEPCHEQSNLLTATISGTPDQLGLIISEFDLPD